MSASVMSSGAVGEHVAAADAPLRAHEARALHRQQDLLEIGLGQRGALGDLLDRRGPVAAAQREREEGAGRVVAARRDLHPSMLARRAVGRRWHERYGARERPYARRPWILCCPRSTVRRSPGIVPALFGRVDDAWIPEPARSADAVVLLVLDGLGWSAVQDHAARACPGSRSWRAARSRPSRRRPRRPRSRRSRPVSRPRSTAIVGYRMLVDDDVLNVLRWTVPGRGRPPDPFDVQRHPPFLGREVPVVDAHRVPRHGLHAGAPARRTARGLAHGGRADRAVRARGRGRRAVRVRVLPGRRHDRARVRPARQCVHARARRSSTASSAS